MKYFIKFSPEIIIKSRQVRKNAINLLAKNIKINLEYFDGFYSIHSLWDKIELEFSDKLDSSDFEKIHKILGNTFGIHSFYAVSTGNFENLHDLFEKIKDYFLPLDNKTFAVRIKRIGTHDFDSVEAERYLGGKFLKISQNLKVNLTDPEVKIKIEIRDNEYIIPTKIFSGKGGFPIGFQSKILSLVSGGFDSGVSTYLMMKRGCKVDFLFFNLGSKSHENGVKQVSYFLNQNFSKSYNAKIIIIDFTEIIAEILTKIHHKYRAIILKRLMLKSANFVNNNRKSEYKAIVMGDSLGQVSSQTLDNMSNINNSSDLLVLRPLISFDKQEIIKISEEIGTYNFACNMPEYCGIVSDKPATTSTEEILQEEEKKLDENIVKKCFENFKVEKIGDFLNNSFDENELEISFLPENGEIIIDVRDTEIAKKNPLKIKTNEILNIPFYEINAKYGSLDKKQTYLLYCDKGVLSLNAGIFLKEQGFENIKLLKIDNFKVKCAK